MLVRGQPHGRYPMVESSCPMALLRYPLAVL